MKKYGSRVSFDKRYPSEEELHDCIEIHLTIKI